MRALWIVAFLSVFAPLTFAQLEHVIQFELAGFSVFENVGQVQIAVELVSVRGGGSRLEGEVIRARISTADLTATAPADYGDQFDVRVMFTDGSAVGSLMTVTLTNIIDDTLDEGPESFLAVLQPSEPVLGDTGNFILGTQETSTITIIDNDLSCSNLAAPAFGSVTLTGRRPGDVATYGCNPGFILIGGDVTRVCQQFTPNSVDWSGGAPICQPTCENLLPPQFGSISLNGQTVGSSATYFCNAGFILVGIQTRVCEQISAATAEWSDGAPVCQPLSITIGLRSISLQEGASGLVCAFISSGTTSGRTFVINYSTFDGTALVATGDYIGTSGTLTFSDATGNVDQCFTVQTLSDTTNELTECFNAQISSTTQDGLTLSPPTATVCIIDDDFARVSLVFPGPPFSSFLFPEDAGSPQICVQVENVAIPFTIDYRTIPLQAQSGVDYFPRIGSLSFSPTSPTACVAVTIIDDSNIEPTECFNFILSDPSPADVVLPPLPTEICIDDNDFEPRVFGFQLSQYFVDENVSPTEQFQVCVRRFRGQLVVNDRVFLQIRIVQRPDSTAEEGTDYAPLLLDPFPIEFNALNDDQLMCAPIRIIDNLLFEENENFYAVVEDTAGTNIQVTLTPDITRITIRDDDLMPTEMPTFGGPMGGDDPHFAIYLQSGKLLCYTVQGEHGFAFNLISNEKVHMNALFVPDSQREEVTWIGSLGIVVKNTHFQGSNTTRLQFDSKVNQIHINDKVTLEARNIDMLTFRNGKLSISEGPVIESFHYPSVRVNLDDLGMQFTVNFTGEHLDMMWNKLEQNQHSHGLIGQFFRKGVDIDVARKLLLLPGKSPVAVMRKPVWAYMEHNVPSNQLCWVAMNPGYQGSHLIDGHYLDYVVDNVLSTDFKFECKHK